MVHINNYLLFIYKLSMIPLILKRIWKKMNSNRKIVFLAIIIKLKDTGWLFCLHQHY